MKKMVLMMTLVVAMSFLGCSKTEVTENSTETNTERVESDSKSGETLFQISEMTNEERAKVLIDMAKNIEFIEKTSRPMTEIFDDDADGVVDTQYDYYASLVNPTDWDFECFYFEGICYDENGNVKEWSTGDTTKWNSGEEKKHYSIMFSLEPYKDFKVTRMDFKNSDDGNYYYIDMTEK